MDTYKLKFTILQYEIFRLLCVKAGEKLNQRQIAGFLSKSPTAVGKSIKKLENEKLINVNRNRRMNLVEISLARDNHKVIALKRAENLKFITETGLSDALEENFPGCTIILFGSYSRGEDTTSSDIDIAIIDGKQKDLDFDKYSKSLERPINIQTYKSLKEIHKELRENICNGIVLVGGIEL